LPPAKTKNRAEKELSAYGTKKLGSAQSEKTHSLKREAPIAAGKTKIHRNRGFIRSFVRFALRNKRSRTQRALVCGTAKRLGREARKAAPSWARTSVGSLRESSRFSDWTVAVATLNYRLVRISSTIPRSYSKTNASIYAVLSKHVQRRSQLS